MSLSQALNQFAQNLGRYRQTDYVKPIVDGLNERAKSDPAFASKVTAAATRVMALKIKMGLA